MVNSIKPYSGDEMKDSSWKKGMLNFLNSSESKAVQDTAATRKFKSGLVTPIKYLSLVFAATAGYFIFGESFIHYLTLS